MTTALWVFDIAMIVTFVTLGLSQILSMVRLVIGPTPGDRILAVDTMVINGLGIVIALGIFFWHRRRHCLLKLWIILLHLLTTRSQFSTRSSVESIYCCMKCCCICT